MSSHPSYVDPIQGDPGFLGIPRHSSMILGGMLGERRQITCWFGPSISQPTPLHALTPPNTHQNKDRTENKRKKKQKRKKKRRSREAELRERERERERELKRGYSSNERNIVRLPFEWEKTTFESRIQKKKNKDETKQKKEKRAQSGAQIKPRISRKRREKKSAGSLKE